MKSIQKTLVTVIAIVFLTSCNSKYKNEISLKEAQIGMLEDQLKFTKESNAGLLSQMEVLSIVSTSGAKSIEKSLENITSQNNYIKGLTSKIQAKDSINLSLIMNLKRSLADVNDDDISIEVRGGVVYVSIADKLLFRSGSIRINTAAKAIIGKIATVINDHKNIDVMVEGHTDNIPMNAEGIVDNWDLSVKRATAVVRMLQDDHYVDPARLTAAGRAEYAPKGDNDSSAGRSQNRRTEIVIQPSLDEFFQLMEGQRLVN